MRTQRTTVLPSAALFNLTRPLPAAYRLGSGVRGAGAAAVAATGAVSGGGVASRARAAGADIPSNIWELLENLDVELAEPEWTPEEPPQNVRAAGRAADDFQEARGKKGGRRRGNAGGDWSAAELAELDY